MDFEKKLAELEKINSELSSESTTLEQGISLFERSLILTRECMEYLTTAKGKVSQIKNELDALLSEPKDM